MPAGRVKVLLPLTSAAVIVGLKFDTVMAAARSGKLRVAFGGVKPGATVQPLVTVKALRAFAERQARALAKRPSDYHRKAAARLKASIYPPEVAALGDSIELRRPKGS